MSVPSPVATMLASRAISSDSVIALWIPGIAFQWSQLSHVKPRHV